MSSSPVLARLVVQGVIGANVRGSLFVSCALAPAYLVIPAGITRIESFCFSGQDVLTAVYLINDVREVGRACFANCPKLERIVCNKALQPYEAELKSGNNAVVVYREG